MVRSTSKWAMSLRHESNGWGDPYGATQSCQQLPFEQFSAKAKAASGILGRIKGRYAEYGDDEKVAGTIRNFEIHFAGRVPEQGDLEQLEEVLKAYVQRKAARAAARQSRLRARGDKIPKLSAAAGAAMIRNASGGDEGVIAAPHQAFKQVRPTSVTLHDSAMLAREKAALRGRGSEGNTPVARARTAVPRTPDVRKDEWFAVSILADQRAEEEDRKQRMVVQRRGAETRAVLATQQAQIDAQLAEERTRDRAEAQRMAQDKERWEAQDRARRRAQLERRSAEKVRAREARRAFLGAAVSEVRALRVEDIKTNLEVRQLIEDDKLKAAAHKAHLRAESDKVTASNKMELERKRVLAVEEQARERQAVSAYQQVLLAREQAREQEVAALKARQDAQGAQAEAMHAAASVEAAVDEAKAAQVQRERERALDAARAQRKQEAVQRVADVHEHVKVQLTALREKELEEVRQDQEEAAAARAAHHKAVRQDAERVAARRERNLAHRRDLERQIAYNHQVLKDGAGARGMTDFERKYNAADLRAAGRL